MNYSDHVQCITLHSTVCLRVSIMTIMLILSQHIDVISEYKKKLENDRPILNLVIIGEQNTLMLYLQSSCMPLTTLIQQKCKNNGHAYPCYVVLLCLVIISVVTICLYMCMYVGLTFLAFFPKIQDTRIFSSLHVTTFPQHVLVYVSFIPSLVTIDCGFQLWFIVCLHQS